MFGVTLRACEREDLRADDGRGSMHLAEVRERELQRSEIELVGGNRQEAVASEAEHTMKSIASV